VKKYFDIDLKNRSITESDPPYYYDGKLYHFEGADGEATYSTDVRKVVRQADGNLRMSGELYNAEDRNDRPETFEALVKPYKFDGKETWAVLRMKSN
ncbi:MAG: hypothetical protein LBN33_04605, partial [Desulfovibrio sp.]|nr:hypothetical protein [Desulfovibrio sp.]